MPKFLKICEKNYYRAIHQQRSINSSEVLITAIECERFFPTKMNWRRHHKK